MTDSNSILKILIELGLVGADQADQAKAKLDAVAQAAANLSAKQNDVIQVTKKDVQAAEEAAEATDKFEVSKRELLESIRGLTREFPLLGEAVKLAFNPFTLIVGGPILAFEALEKVVDLVKEDLTEIAMPDFDLPKVDAATAAWRGLANARRDANAEFNDPDNIYKRATAELQAQLTATKDLMEAEKQRALATLELNKESLAPGDYAARKSRIETAYASQESQAQRAETQQELARKYEQQANAQMLADQASRSAAAIKLPSDHGVDNNIEAQQKRIETLNEEIKKHQAAQHFIDEAENSNPMNQVTRWEYASTYGRMPTDEARKMEKEQEDLAAAERDAVQAEIERQKRLLAERQRLEKIAEDAQKQADSLLAQLPVDRAAIQRKIAGEDAAYDVQQQARALQNFQAAGQGIGQTVAGATGGINLLEQLKAAGFTVEGIHDAAETARQKQDLSQPLTAQDQQALLLDQQVQAAQAQVQRLQELATAAGANGQAIIAAIDRSIQLHTDSYTLHQQQLALITGLDARIRALTQQVQQLNLNHQ